MTILAIIQARYNSTRLPGKVFMKVNGKSMLSRVCRAARDSELVNKVVVAWAHKFPHLDQEDVLGRFREIVLREKPDLVIRLTSDCPLLNSYWIDNAVAYFRSSTLDYFCNHKDGFDVQVFYPSVLWSNYTDREHVIADFNTPSTGLSVNTLADLERVNELAVLSHL